MSNTAKPTNYLKLTNDELNTRRLIEKGFYTGATVTAAAVVALLATDQESIPKLLFSAAALIVGGATGKWLKDRERTKAIQARAQMIVSQYSRTGLTEQTDRIFLANDMMVLAEHKGFLSPKTPKPKPQPAYGMGQQI